MTNFDQQSLFNRFFFGAENKINCTMMPEWKYKELQQGLDLLRAINTYRTYPSLSQLFHALPELREQEHFAKLIWKYLSGLSAEEVADLAIEMIHEVSLTEEAVI